MSGRVIASPTIVTRISELEKLAVFPGNLIRNSPIQLQLPSFPSEDSEHWQTAINRHLTDCGCSQGAFATLASVLIYSGYLAAGSSGSSLGGWARVELGFAIGVTAGLLGKIAGLIRAKTLLGRTIKELKTRGGYGD